MRILIVEDDKTKSARLQSFLKTKYPDEIPQFERSYQGGLARVELETFDLILMDMSLPTFNARPSVRLGRPRAFGGYDIMRKMHKKGLVAKIVIVSALEKFGEGDARMTFEEITEKCEDEFPELYAGAVFFKQSDSRWERRLGNILRRTFEKAND